jgi:hypothetical protein
MSNPPPAQWGSPPPASPTGTIFKVVGIAILGMVLIAVVGFAWRIYTRMAAVTALDQAKEALCIEASNPSQSADGKLAACTIAFDKCGEKDIESFEAVVFFHDPNRIVESVGSAKIRVQGPITEGPTAMQDVSGPLRREPGTSLDLRRSIPVVVITHIVFTDKTELDTGL